MGFDCGFDVFPRLDAADEADKRAYQGFLDDIIDIYRDAYNKEGRREDGIVLQLPGDSGGGGGLSEDYIYFMVGECPKMPANPERCDYFLRFSSKVSGGLTMCAEPYIRSVHRIAKKWFGHRVHWWHELNELAEDPRKWMGCYSWSAVHEADTKLKALRARQEQAEQSGNNGDG
jgi:hypothetical protein